MVQTFSTSTEAVAASTTDVTQVVQAKIGNRRAESKSGNAATTMTGMGQRESNFTLLTLVHCVVYLVGNCIDCFAPIANIFALDIYVKYGFVNITGNALFFASHSVNVFVYYIYNRVFRQQFNQILVRIKV